MLEVTERLYECLKALTVPEEIRSLLQVTPVLPAQHKVVDVAAVIP